MLKSKNKNFTEIKAYFNKKNIENNKLVVSNKVSFGEEIQKRLNIYIYIYIYFNKR